MNNSLFDQFPPTLTFDGEDHLQNIDMSEFSGRIIFDLKCLDCDEEDEVFFLCGFEMAEEEWMLYDQHDNAIAAIVEHIFEKEHAEGRLDSNTAESMHGMILKNGQSSEECKRYIVEKLLDAGCFERSE